MSADLRPTALGFADCFPGVVLDRAAFSAAQGQLSQAGPLSGRLGGFALAMFMAPPVNRLLWPFVHTMTVSAARALGVDRAQAELLGAEIMGSLDPTYPLTGFVVAIAAPRSGVTIEVLRRHDAVIAAIHRLLKIEGAVSIGPREHRQDVDHGTASQWDGHVTNECSPTVEHDAALMLCGPSVGLGEAAAVARSLAIPSVAVELAEPQPGSRGKWQTPSAPCRLLIDDVVKTVVSERSPGESVQTGPTAESEDRTWLTADRRSSTPVEWDADVSVDFIAQAAVTAVRDLAVHIRSAQRRRIVAIGRLDGHRRYLADALKGDASLPTDAELTQKVSNPFRFAAMSDVERDSAAVSLGCLSRDDFMALLALPPDYRRGFATFVANSHELSSPHDQGRLLRSAQREMLAAAGSEREWRRQRWSQEDAWERAWDATRRRS